MKEAALNSKVVTENKPKSRRFNLPHIFGYDFFISFKLGPPPIGAQSYASDLARRLRELDFTVFFSEEEAPPGAKLDDTLVKALNRSQILVVVANEGALLHSQWVRKEVEEFRRKHPKNLVIPINIDRAIEQHGPQVEASRWLDPDGRIWLDETRKALEEGITSPEVVKRLEVAPRFLKANTWLRLVTGGIILSLATLTAFAFLQRSEAIREAQRANAGRLAAEAQVALVASLQIDHPGAPDSQRGILLALESLRVQRNLQADRIFKEGLRRLSGPSVDVKLEEGDVLRALGPQAGWIAIQRGDTQVVFDTETRMFRPPNAIETSLLKGASIPPDEKATMRAAVFARSSDGRFELVESEKGLGDWIFASLALIRVADNKILSILPHDWHVREAIFKKDDRYLLTVTGRASMDAEDPSATRLVGSSVYVWEVPSGEKVTEISFADKGGITELAVDRENEWLAVQTSDASGERMIVMPIWPDLARSEACRRLNRNLSPSEWASFVAVGQQVETCPGLPRTSE